MKMFTHHSYGYFMLTVVLLMTQGCRSSGAFQDPNAHQQLAPSEPVSEDPVMDEDYQIRPGDEIEILVWEQSSFNTETTVSSKGTIAVPLIGEVEAGGLTQDQLERELIDRLSEYISGEINLTLAIHNTDNMLVSVFGMVEQPDNYPIVEQVSLFKVISTAGGISQDANLRSVHIYRRDQSGHDTIDLTYYLENGQLESPSLMIQPGDVVYVPRQENVVRELSDFMRDAVYLFGIFRIFN